MSETTQDVLGNTNTNGLASFEQLLCRLTATQVIRLFDRFPPNVIYSLSMTSYAIYCVTEYYKKQGWNIDLLLSAWFLNPLTFRKKLSRYHAIIGGMTALQFFDRSVREVAVCDIFVQFNGLFQIGHHLIQLGYHFQPDRGDDKSWDVVAVTLAGKLRFDSRRADANSSFVSGHIRTFRFTRLRRPLNQTVRLTLLRMHPVKWMLTGQTSEFFCFPFVAHAFEEHVFVAASMTFITSSYAVSLFPHETFVNRNIYVCRKMARLEQDISWDWVNGYFGKSCRIVDTSLSGLTNVCSREVITSARHIGDAISWVIRFKIGLQLAHYVIVN
jgi:hypothetical protein